jgi:hypothetical protein
MSSWKGLLLFGDSIISGGFSILLWIGYIIALALYAKAFASYTYALLSAYTQLPIDDPASIYGVL